MWGLFHVKQALSFAADQECPLVKSFEVRCIYPELPFPCCGAPSPEGGSRANPSSIRRRTDLCRPGGALRSVVSGSQPAAEVLPPQAAQEIPGGGAAGTSLTWHRLGALGLMEASAADVAARCRCRSDCQIGYSAAT